VEDERRLIGVLEEGLTEDVQKDTQKQEASDRDSDLRSQTEAREPLGERASKVLHETHSGGEKQELSREQKKKRRKMTGTKNRALSLIPELSSSSTEKQPKVSGD
jgi:hypothetical protein